MNINIKRDSTQTCFEIEGRLDTNTAPALEKAVKDELDSIKNLVLDFKGLEYISSAGLRVILATKKSIDKVGSMKITNVRESVMDIFEITGFADILNIE